MVFYMQEPNLKDILEGLWELACLGLNYEGDSDYKDTREQLLNQFKDKPVNEAIILFNSLDLNNYIDAQIISFLPDIVKNMCRKEDQHIFVENIKSLQERYPNVNFGPSLFYAGLNYNFDDLSLSGKSTDSFDAGNNVHFFK